MADCLTDAMANAGVTPEQVTLTLTLTLTLTPTLPLTLTLTLYLADDAGVPSRLPQLQDSAAPAPALRLGGLA